MKVTTKSRYALRALISLAGERCDTPVSLAKIAQSEAISLNFLEQIFMSLRRAGIVNSVRGPSGGYCLARDPGEISVAEIFAAVKEPLFMVRCADEHTTLGAASRCPRRGNCKAREAWVGLGRHIQRFLESVSLGDLLKGRNIRAIVEDPQPDPAPASTAPSKPARKPRRE